MARSRKAVTRKPTKDRDKIAGRPFRLRIALTTSDAGPTRTEVSVYGNGRPEVLKFHGGPNREKLELAVRGYARALGLIVGRPWSPEAHNQPTDAELLTLQGAAISLFGLIFRHANPDREPKVREDLDFYLSHKKLVEITFDSNLPGIPFDALHHGPAGSPYDVSGFVGFRAPILHAPRIDKDPRVEPEGPLSVGLLGTAKLTSVGLRDEKSVYSVFDERGCACSAREHTPLCGQDGAHMAVADLPALFRALSHLRSVWHITSHMHGIAEQQYFTLDNSLQVRPEFFSPRQSRASRFVGEPLVFMNLCSSASGGIVEDANFPDALHLLAAGGVVATHCLVYERFATEFARRFYRIAVSSNSQGERPGVGESLYRARDESLRGDGSIASLSYSFHANADFTLPEAGDDNADADTTRGGLLHGAA